MREKKIVLLITGLTVAFALFTACGTGTTSDNTGNETTAPATQTTVPQTTAQQTTAPAATQPVPQQTAQPAPQQTAPPATQQTAPPATQQTAPPATKQTAPPATQGGNLIGPERAKKIALADAGFTEGQVMMSKLTLDYEDGIQVYDVEFYSGRFEYEYEIDARTGAILEKDIDD